MGFTDDEQSLIQSEIDRTRAFLASGRTATTPRDLADRADARVEERLSEMPPPRRALACAPGCSFCCRTKVRVSPPEVLRIAEYLRTHLSAADLEALRARVAAVDAVTRGKPAAEYEAAGVACPLLVDQRCSVYSVRPLACRGFHSFDAAACEQRFSGTEAGSQVPIELDGPRFKVPALVRIGLQKGLRSSGLEGDDLELCAALRIALERENAGDRWLRGHKPFAMARNLEDG